jgi:hypothetical protein
MVWDRFGAVANYVEPFFGSGAMLLGRPGGASGIETVNDKDGMVANFWRAVAADPEAVAHHADWPVNENDQHARHIWLVAQKDSLQARLEGDPGWYDAKVAGWWVWGLCCWIGGGWCSGDGPWRSVDGQLVHLGDAGQGVHRQLVHLGSAGRGVHRQLVHLGSAGQGVHRKRVHLGSAGQGVHRQLVHLGDAGRGVHRKLVHLGGAGQNEGLLSWMQALANRLRHVRVCSGDWLRVCGPTPTVKIGLTAVFLDPPYADTAGRTEDIYVHDSTDVAHDVREWAIAHGDDRMLRIALCGYEGEHVMPASWECVAWKSRGGYGSQSEDGDGRENARRERIWFSPHCLSGRQRSIFDGLDDVDV